MSQQIASNGAQNVGQFYYQYKHSQLVNIAGVVKAMSTPTDIATYIVQSFYDNAGGGAGQRTDLIQVIETGIGLYKGNI